jgi:GT2 family glycosyltransferase
VTDKKNKTVIVILNWNGEKFLKQFLPSVVEHSKGEGNLVVIADNGSSDNSITYVKATFPDVKCILFDKNHGFTGGYNKALQQIDAEYFVLLNSDVEVSRNWLNPVIKMMDADKNIAAAGPKILSYLNKNQFEYAGASGGYIDKFGYTFCRGRIISSIEEDRGQYNDISDVFWASGAALFVRADLYKQFGGLDNDFFAHMEEIDLCWRFKNAGYRIAVNPKSVVYHVGGGTLPSNNSTKIFLNYRNNLFLLLKNLPKRKIFPIIFSRLILDGFSGMVYLLTFKFSFFAAVIKAHFAFYFNISKILKKRNGLKFTVHKEVFNKSIVVQYFIKNSKTFDKLDFNNQKR